MTSSTPLKTCRGCGETHPATSEFFIPNKECKHGVTSTCRVCTNARGNDWRRRNSVDLAARRRADYAVRWGPRNRANERLRAETKPFKVRAGSLTSGVLTRCREKGWARPEWLTTKNVEAWLRRQPNCSCCGVEFAILPNGSGQMCDASPSFDRFDVSETYELGNVRLICWRCNNIKRNYSAADLRLVADWIESEKTKFNEAAA